jgi:hypothetical protein
VFSNGVMLSMKSSTAILSGSRPGKNTGMEPRKRAMSHIDIVKTLDGKSAEGESERGSVRRAGSPSRFGIGYVGREAI